ncbi:hypothetical protein MTO96_017019 [Rhipicephalus appendiculatus]
MAASNRKQPEAVPSAVDEKWVLLQRNGDAGKEHLLEERNGDTRKITPNATEGQGGAEDTDKFLWWLRSALKDVSIRNALWDDRRRYVLVACLCVNSVLHVLVALASQAECGTLQALFSCLKHFTTATLSAAVFSMATRFLSLTAVKHIPWKKGQWNYLSGDLVLANAMILLTACFACTYEVRAGIMVLQEARRDESFVWYLQLLADMTRVQVLAASVVLANLLVVLMGVDVRDAFHAYTQSLEEEWRQLVTEEGPNVRYTPSHTSSTLWRINNIILVATLGRFIRHPSCFSGANHQHPGHRCPHAESSPGPWLAEQSAGI